MTHAQTGRRVRKNAEDNSLDGRLVTVHDPSSAASEAYRMLRANLLYAAVDAPPKVLLVTSPGPAEGKSTLCANLGVVLAQSGKRTLVIDCDLRRPVMHQIFGLHNTSVGLVNVVVGERTLQEACQEPLPDLGLKVLTVGALPPNPAEFLASRRFAEVLATARETFDYVVLDSSPMGQVSDPTAIAVQADGVLLTLDASKTRKGSVQRAMRGLNAVGANVLGTVMNNAKGSTDVYY
jgi:capsular exopolysaccharide synthesis family protein